jgi:hypothetical protein
MSLNFPLHQSLRELCGVDLTHSPGTFMVDNNVGEMFLNFPLHQSLRELCGVDLTHYFAPELGKKVTWERWSRCAMGLKPSPYNTVLMMMVGQEVILGDKDKEMNVFWWKRVVLNCQGSPGYNPSMPWVYKVRRGKEESLRWTCELT